MKKILTTAMVLGALYGTANAAPVTSPIYMPEVGKILSEVNVGYTTSKFNKRDKIEDPTDKLYEAWNIGAEGQFGLMERLSMNYGFDFDFARKLYKQDRSAAFNNFYLGVTGRVLDADANKLDIIFNVGQGQNIYADLTDHVYAELAARYGLELDMYNLGFTVGIRYNNDYEGTKTESGRYKVEKDFDIHLGLENEFIFTENFTVGLDLYLDLNSESKVKNQPSGFLNAPDSLATYKVKGYNEYGFNVDANYGLDANNFVGIYFNMAFNDVEFKEEDGTKGTLKDGRFYRFGLKFTSQF